MKLILQLQLLPDKATAQKLQATVERFNEACNWAAGVAFEQKITRKFVLQKIVYREIRNRFGLPADTTLQVVRRVSSGLSKAKTTQLCFRKHAAVPYTANYNYTFKSDNVASLAGLVGRLLVPFVLGEHQKKLFDLKKGQADLILRKDGRWFLHVSVEAPEEPEAKTQGFLGVDLGVTNLAVDSDQNVYSGKEVEAKRVKLFRQKQEIQQKATGTHRSRRRSLHLALSRIGSKEGRYRQDINHQISKRIVDLAEGTKRTIVLENLKGIRDRTQFRKQQRAKMGGWGFFQLRTFIEYKAKLAGVRVVLVNPRNTSRTCSKCDHCEKANRKSQAEFECRKCGFRTNADLNAAENIRALGVVLIGPEWLTPSTGSSLTAG